MVNYKEKIHLPRFQRGPIFSRGGVQLFPVRLGVQLLIPYRNPYILLFSRGGGSGPPSGSAHACGVVPPYRDLQISKLEVDLNMVTHFLYTIFLLFCDK